MKRIIVGIDGSSQARQALRTAADLARQTGSSLQLVHVVPEAEAWPLAEPTIAAEIARRAALQEKHAKALLTEATDLVKGEGLELQPIVKAGSPAEVLADLAAAPEVTMVVVGHRGRNVAARLLIGSVADRLVQISSKPVLVVR